MIQYAAIDENDGFQVSANRIEVMEKKEWKHLSIGSISMHVAITSWSCYRRVDLKFRVQDSGWRCWQKIVRGMTKNHRCNVVCDTFCVWNRRVSVLLIASRAYYKQPVLLQCYKATQ
jgi:hypothetical protein